MCEVRICPMSLRVRSKNCTLEMSMKTCIQRATSYSRSYELFFNGLLGRLEVVMPWWQWAWVVSPMSFQPKERRCWTRCHGARNEPCFLKESSEKGTFQKERIVFLPSFLRGELAVSLGGAILLMIDHPSQSRDGFWCFGATLRPSPLLKTWHELAFPSKIQVCLVDYKIYTYIIIYISYIYIYRYIHIHIHIYIYIIIYIYKYIHMYMYIYIYFYGLKTMFDSSLRCI